MECLIVQYKWGLGGTWHTLVIFGLTTYDQDYYLIAATSSTLYLKMVDELQDFDPWFIHTWYFGYEPVLTAHWD